MPAWRREVEACIASVVGAPIASWIAWGEAMPRPGSVLPHLVLSLVGVAPSTEERARALGEIGAALAPAGRLVVIDHNRPRRYGAALAAVLGPPPVPGRSPAARWRRLAYPTAREVQAAGFPVECLRLAAGERIQLVFARR